MRCVRLVDETGALDPAELEAAAAALQIQLDRDLAVHWGVRALVVGGDGSAASWSLRIVAGSRLPAGAGGIHLDDVGQPYALVAAGPGWTVAASHELLEMMVDPFGNRFVGGPSPDPAAGGRAVYHLVEICDPCETSTYTVNGIRVSGFVLPAFYQASAPGPWDLLGQVQGALRILPGGYLSWYDPQDGAWHQALPDGTFAATPVDGTDAGSLDASDLRGHRDRVVGGARHDLSLLLTPVSEPGPEPERAPTFGVDDPRKDALDVVKPTERAWVAARSPARPAPAAPQTATAPGGRAFVRPDERPDVGRPVAATPPAATPPPASPSPPTRRAGRAPARKRARPDSST